MVFSSAIFLFALLPLVFALSRLVPGIKGKNIILAVASLCFYGWGQPRHILLLLGSVCLNFFFGRALINPGAPGRRKVLLLICLCANLLLLFLFKYLNFITENLGLFWGNASIETNIILPVGISFFTFQGMSYIIDVYRTPDSGSRSFLKILLYISFFPQLVAGPIIKYHDIEAELSNRRTSRQLTAEGVRRFILGLAKKLFIANTLGQVADAVYALSDSELSMALCWLAAICYTLQIYFDFSGYSDMAIGLGKIFGFHFAENFNYPYTSKSVGEFWRRWHISLTTWFREYLYIPLGGNRKGEVRTQINKFIVFLLCGLWHGASWNFVIWGIFHGLLITLEGIVLTRLKGLRSKRLTWTFGHVYTILAVTIGFVIFRAPDMQSALWFLLGMFGGMHESAEAIGIFQSLFTPLVAVTLAVGILASTRVFALLLELLQKTKGVAVFNAASNLGYAALYALCVLNLASSSFNPFIYFQF